MPKYFAFMSRHKQKAINRTVQDTIANFVSWAPTVLGGDELIVLYFLLLIGLHCLCSSYGSLVKKIYSSPFIVFLCMFDHS